MARDPKAPCGPMGILRRLGARAWMVVLVVATMASAPLADAVPASAELVSPDVAAICDEAERLSADSADDALALIVTIRENAPEGSEAATACEGQRLAIILASVTTAADSAKTADDAVDELAAVCAVAAGLVADDPQKALDLVTKVRDSAAAGSDAENGCEDERLAAVTVLADGSQPNTPAERASDQWTSAFESWIAPLGQSLSAVLLLIVIALIAARLLVLLPSDLARSRLVPEIKAARSRAIRGWLGLIALVVGSIAIAALLAGLPPAPLVDEILLEKLFPLRVLAWVGSALLLLVGIRQVARALASTLALTITVHDAKGAEDKARKSALITYLAELGTNQPRGVLIQQASDITAMAEAALPTTTNPVLTVLRSIFTTVVGVTPWNVSVDNVNETRTAVLISRNGRSVSSALVSTERWKHAIGETKLDPDKLAAAAIIATLADHYSDFNGLNGATQWESIGLHFVATTDYRSAPETRALILAAALDVDPGNRAAALALKQALYGASVEPQETLDYAIWLRKLSLTIDAETNGSLKSQSDDGVLDLHRRVLVNFFVAAANLAAAHANSGARSARLNYAYIHGRAARFRQLVGPDTPESGGFRDRVKGFAEDPLAAIERLYSASRPPVSRSVAALGNRNAYNAACTLVLSGKRLDRGVPSDRARLRELFQIAFQDSDLKKRARQDPTLQALHGDAEFAKLVEIASGSTLWDLNPFKPVKQKLNDIGVASPSQLHTRKIDASLDYYLGMGSAQVQNLVEVSKLFRAAEDVAWAHSTNSTSKETIEVLAELLKIGVRVPLDIRPEWTDTTYPNDGLPEDPSVIVKISHNIYERTWEVVDLKQLAQWLRAVRERGAELGF